MWIWQYLSLTAYESIGMDKISIKRNNHRTYMDTDKKEEEGTEKKPGD